MGKMKIPPAVSLMTSSVVKRDVKVEIGTNARVENNGDTGKAQPESIRT